MKPPIPPHRVGATDKVFSLYSPPIPHLEEKGYRQGSVNNNGEKKQIIVIVTPNPIRPGDFGGLVNTTSINHFYSIF